MFSVLVAIGAAAVTDRHTLEICPVNRFSAGYAGFADDAVMAVIKLLDFLDNEYAIFNRCLPPPL